MTPDNHTSGAPLGRPAVDKILDHNRLQLSALLDGELSPHEARFLLRRLQHDPELAACWERWNLCGDVLRGRVEVMASNGFSEGVAAARAAVPMAKPTRGASDSRRLRWGGGAALAASVAMIALFVGRQSPNSGSPAMPTVQVATSSVVAPPASVRDAAPTMPGHAAELASVLAVADVPRRLTARRSRGQSQRAAMRMTQRSVAQAPIVMASAAPQALPQTDPFSTQRAGLITRPWPRALLPGAPANGAFTVDYGTRSGEVGGANSPSFYPFEPHVPVSMSSTPRSPP